MPDHVLPSSLFYVLPTKHIGKQNSIVSIFAIWNTMMGTSLLTMPWGIEQAGFVLGVFCIAFMGALTFYTAYRVVKSQDYIDGEVFEFSDVCKHYLGKWGERTSIGFALVTFLGAMIVYWVLMTNFLYAGGIFLYEEATHHHFRNNSSSHDVLCPTNHDVPHRNGSHNHSLFGNEDIDIKVQGPHYSNLWTSNLSCPFYLALLLFPLLNFKSPTFFTKFNCLGTLSVVFVLAFVITKATNWGLNFEFTFQIDPSGFEVPGFRLTFTALTGLLSLAFFLHNAVITILKNNKHQENNIRDLSVGYLLVALTYLIVSVAFYVSFPLPKTCIAENLLDNFSQSDTFASVARLLLLFQMTTVYPLLAYMFRVIALYAIYNSAWPGVWHVIFVNCLLVCCGVLVAIFYPNIGDIIRYSGSLCGMVYTFFLPSLIYILAMRAAGRLSRLSFTIHCMIMIFGVLNFIAQFVIAPS